MIAVILLATIVSCCYGLLGAGTEQAVAVKGRLMCFGEPAVGVQVILYDEDVLLNAQLGETKTDHEGNFAIHGTGREISKIDPLVKIFHDCYNRQLFGKRQLWVWVPEKYVNEGNRATQTYDFFQMELSGMFHEWCPSCSHSHSSSSSSSG